jgi:hypothetical protein
VHRAANATGRPWVWWDYVADYHLRCSMKENKYSKTCAEGVVRSLGARLGFWFLQWVVLCFTSC